MANHQKKINLMGRNVECSWGKASQVEVLLRSCIIYNIDVYSQTQTNKRMCVS